MKDCEGVHAFTFDGLHPDQTKEANRVPKSAICRSLKANAATIGGAEQQLRSYPHNNTVSHVVSLPPRTTRVTKNSAALLEAASGV